MPVDNDANNKIFKRITSGSPLDKPAPDHYHVSLTRIDNVDANKAKELKAFLVAAAKKVCNPVIIPTSDLSADRYLSGGRKYGKSPIVLTVTGQSEETFRTMNKAIFQALLTYNKKNKVQKGTNWMGKEFISEYVPHITVASTKYIDGQNPTKKTLNRDQVISDLNEKIKNSPFQIPVSLK
jgi:2'-5' RNA ligase